MRKIKVNYQQVLDVLSMHFEAINVIRTDEKVDITPFFLRNGMLTLTVTKGN